MKETPVLAQHDTHARLPQLDGLRAVAILMVLAQHSGLFDLGWAGVHLFFVLSGFLITGILRRARHDAHFWGPFYTRRATRILPPLLPFFLFCALTVSIDWKTTGLAYIFFGANIVQSLPHVPVTELTVLWSLAVEEHFYFVWPFAIRLMRRRHLLALLAGILLLEPVARALATPHVAGWFPIYFLTCFQLDGLAAGAALALLLEHAGCRAWLLRFSGWFAIAFAAVFAACTRDARFVREANAPAFNAAGYTLIVLVFVCLLAFVYLKPKALVSRVLSWRPMVFVGVISYGMYLYAGPAMHVVERLRPAYSPHPGRVHLVLTAIGLVLVILVSWISFRLYETPIVRWGRSRAKALVAGC